MMQKKEPMEIEVKIPVRDKEEVCRKLKENGFRQGITETETDTYFNSEQYDLKKRDKALRIRVTQDKKSGKCRTELNCKGPRLDKVSMSRKEIEISLEDSEKMSMILAELGFYPAGCTVKKQRTFFYGGRVTAAVDQVEGLGIFLELEILEEGEEKRTPCLREIEETMEKLGYQWKHTVRTSYLSMLEKEKNHAFR